MTEALKTGRQRLLSRLVLHLRWPAAIVALAGLLLSAWVHIESMRGVDVEFRWSGVWLLHYALFPTIVVAVLTASAAAGQERRGLRDFLALIPAWGLTLLAVALAYVLATFLIFAPSSGAGDPLIQDGRFFFNDHGIIREVTEERFHLQRGVSLRLFSSVWLYLYLVAAVYSLGARRRR